MTPLFSQTCKDSREQSLMNRAQKMKQKQISEKPRMSNAAVSAKTGKNWSEWFAILDAVNAGAMLHQEIVKFIKANFKISTWWQQMIAVNYEEARGLREKYQKRYGFEISRSKSINVNIRRLFNVWIDEDRRKTWLRQQVQIQRFIPFNSLTATWLENHSKLDVKIYEKGYNKSLIIIQHNKLPDSLEAARMKEFWSEKLDYLKKILETEDVI